MGGGGGQLTLKRGILNTLNYARTIPIRLNQRKIYDIEGISNGKQVLHAIPYHIQEWYWTSKIASDVPANSDQISPWAKLFVGTASAPDTEQQNPAVQGYRIHESQFQIKNLIILQDELIASGGTTVETTTFNATPYMYVGIDTQNALKGSQWTGDVKTLITDRKFPTIEAENDAFLKEIGHSN